jgi:ABC-type multidrug transport system ATPase subunit
MLLDEPTSGLDANAAAQIEAILNQRLAAGAAILLITHTADQAKRLASRHLAINAGLVSEAVL